MGANELLAELAGIGRTPSGGYSRLSWDPATMQLREWFVGQAAAAGLELTEDGNGNQVAWWGHGPDALLLGSHLDSVPDGGPLDGPLGVASALAAIGRLKAEGWQPRASDRRRELHRRGGRPLRGRLSRVAAGDGRDRHRPRPRT